MNKKLLIGIIVVFVIAATIFLPMLIAGASLVVWIYLVWMVRNVQHITWSPSAPDID